MGRKGFEASSRPSPTLPHGAAGFSVPELLVAMVVGFLVTGAGLALCAAGNRALVALGTGQSAWSETRAIATLWAVEWRGAGYDPTGASGARVERLAPDAMEISADWNANGTLVPTDANPNERLAYAVEPGAWRRGVNGGPRLVAAWPDSARFAFRDSGGLDLGQATDLTRARIADARTRLPGGRRSAALEVRWVVGRRNP